jgi:hypothetical protein
VSITVDQAEAIAAKISPVHLRLILLLNETVRSTDDGLIEALRETASS